MNNLILHHYWGSPYAEKIRLLLGYRAVPWRSLEVPAVPPRPTLEPVLGTFRRTPVLQIGADFFCDTRLIAKVLDELGSGPPLVTPANRAVCELISGWVEPRAFVMTGPVRFQSAQDVALLFDTVSPQAFSNDRAPFMAPAIDVARFAELRASAEDHLRAYLRIIAGLLADGRPWIGGVNPCYADFSVYHLVWWLRATSSWQLLRGMAAVLDTWADRMARIGHGAFVSASAEDAFAAVQSAEQTPWRPDWPGQSDARIGLEVAIMPDDYGRNAVRGVLIGSSEHHVSLRRRSELGEVRIHLPRLGYEIV